MTTNIDAAGPLDRGVSRHTEAVMLRKWVEVLPLFVVRWIALRHAERFRWYHGPRGENPRDFAVARSDVFFKVPTDEQKRD